MNVFNSQLSFGIHDIYIYAKICGPIVLFVVVVKRCHGKSFIYHYINRTGDNQLFFYMKFTFFFQHMIFNKDISAANLRYVTTKLDLVMDSACDKSLFGC